MALPAPPVVEWYRKDFVFSYVPKFQIAICAHTLEKYEFFKNFYSQNSL